MNTDRSDTPAETHPYGCQCYAVPCRTARGLIVDGVDLVPMPEPVTAPRRGPFVKGAVPMRWKFDTLLNNLSAAAIDLPASSGAFEAARAALCRAFDALLAERDTAIQKQASMASHLTTVMEELKKAQANVKTATTSRSDVWFWQGDGDDDPTSLACPVVMEPETLRAILAERDAALAVLRLYRIKFAASDMGSWDAGAHLAAKDRLLALGEPGIAFDDVRAALAGLEGR